MCIPGDNRVNVLGLYSVQKVRKRQTHCERQEQHFHHSPWVREKVKGGGGDILATALETDKHTVLSMYSVHRINPQCVLTNITQLPPDWFVSVGEARSSPVQPAPPSDPRPQALKPQHGQDAGVFPSGYTFACNKKLYRWIEDSGESVQPGFDAEQWGGDGAEDGRRSYTIKLEVFG